MLKRHMTSPTSRRPNRLATRSSWMLVGAFCTAMAGCDASRPWDAEFDYAGREQSMASFAGDAPGKAVRKEYPFNIDFHLRANTAMVRSSLVQVSAGPDEVVRFEARGVNVWVSGQFDQRSKALSLVEERTLDMAGRPQQVRLTGQYTCEAVGGNKVSA
jgi:hypothetical protein